MDLLKEKTSKIFKKFFFTALGSSLIISIYSIVDMVCVGQYEGAAGSAALSVVMPVYSIILSLGLLIGVGGSVLFSVSRGGGNEQKAQSFFTMSVIIGAGVACIITVLIAVLKEPLLRFFGADDSVLPLALAYLNGLMPALPVFTIEQTIFMFIRNDNNPVLPTLAVLIGGGFNIFGDIFFVFVLGMGAFGAGTATFIGEYIAVGICLIHFFKKKNNLKFVKISNPFKKMRQIFATGFAPFIVDVSFGVLVIIFNNQIMAFAGSTELAVFGCVANVTALVCCVFYSVGEALQPIVSINYGAALITRVREILKISIIVALILGIISFCIVFLFPDKILGFFMDAGPDVLLAGPPILRIYSVSYLMAGVNISVCHYFQAVLKTKYSIIISVLRGFVVSIVLLFVLPYAFGFDYIWFAMPITEAVVLLVTLILLKIDRLDQNKKVWE